MATQSPKGFRFATINAGFRKEDRPNLALVLSDTPAVAAGVFTTNRFQAAPVIVARENLAQNGMAQAVLINSGQANACTGKEGVLNCRATLNMVSEALAIEANGILPASTGVIGPQLLMDKWQAAMGPLAEALAEGTCTPDDFANAIRTTDIFPKIAYRSLMIQGVEVQLVGMAKGAGMICPNMATMLATVLCDATVAPEVWQKMFRDAVDKTFNRVTVDGDTSTNDTVFGLANGAAGVAIESAEDIEAMSTALTDVLGKLAYMLVQDGEGATKVIRIRITGAVSDAEAEQAARTIGHSQLVKTAMYGRDANWGRIVGALGRSGCTFEADDVVVSLCDVELFRNGQPNAANFDDQLNGPLEGRDITIDIELGAGSATYELLASDLTHDYVSCNADYRS